MEKLVTISAKIPEIVFKEMLIRIPEGERSRFIRDAIIEKLQHTPKPDKILELEKRISQLEKRFEEIKMYLGELEILTHEHGKVNPYSFCIDEVDRKIIEYLLHYKGATTPELAQHTGTNRWLVLNRLRKIQKTSKKQLGKPIIEYCAEERAGKRKAWWITQEITEE
jgi:hypothetical protein